MKQLGFRLLALAVVEWTGWGKSWKPARDESALIERFGESLALELLPLILELEEDFYRSDAYNTVSDLDEMGARAADEFQLRHPEIPVDAANALAWCYKFDWK